MRSFGFITLAVTMLGAALCATAAPAANGVQLRDDSVQTSGNPNILTELHDFLQVQHHEIREFTRVSSTPVLSAASEAIKGSDHVDAKALIQKITAVETKFKSVTKTIKNNRKIVEAIGIHGCADTLVLIIKASCLDSNFTEVVD